MKYNVEPWQHLHFCFVNIGIWNGEVLFIFELHTFGSDTSLCILMFTKQHKLEVQETWYLGSYQFGYVFIHHPNFHLPIRRHSQAWACEKEMKFHPHSIFTQREHLWCHPWPKPGQFLMELWDPGVLPAIYDCDTFKRAVIQEIHFFLMQYLKDHITNKIVQLY